MTWLTSEWLDLRVNNLTYESMTWLTSEWLIQTQVINSLRYSSMSYMYHILKDVVQCYTQKGDGTTNKMFYSNLIKSVSFKWIQHVR